MSTPNASQSVRFSAAHVPHGHYELCVIANGISSYCVHFGHQPPHKPCGCQVCLQQEAGCACHEVCKPDFSCKEVSIIEPEIIELRGEIKRLHKSVHRLDSLIKIEEPHRERKEVTKKETGEEEHEKKEEQDQRRDRRKDRKSTK